MKKQLPYIVIGVVLISIFWGDIIFGPSVLYDQDILTEYVPLQTFVSKAIAGGGKGWWNPFAAMGTPLLADGHAGIYYLPAIFYRWTGADPSALGLFLALHLLYCFVFACAFAREMGAGKTASILAGIVCTFGGYQTAIVSTFLYALSITHTPALFYFLTKMLKTGKIKFGIILGLIFSQQFCIGYFPFTFNTLIALLVFFCFAVTWNEWKLWSKPLIISALIGIMFSLPQLLPTLEFIPLSSFEGGVKYDYMVSNSMSPKLLLSYFFPLIWGNNQYSEFSDLEMSVFDFDELHNYLGLLPLFFAFFALFLPKNNYQRSLLILGVLTFVFSLGEWAFGLYHILVHIPGFNFFKDPAKWLVHTNLMLVVFAAIGLESFLESSLKNHARKLAFFLIPLFLFQICYLSFEQSFSSKVIIQFLVVFFLSLVIVLLPARKTIKTIVVCIFVFVELLMIEVPLIPKQYDEFYSSKKWHITQLKEQAKKTRAVDGVFSHEQSVWNLEHLLADVGTFHQIPTLTVTSPFVTKAWSEMRDWAEDRGMDDLQRFRTEDALVKLTPFIESLNVGNIIDHQWLLTKLPNVRPRAYLSFNPEHSEKPLQKFLAGCDEGKCPEAILTETFNLKSDVPLIPAKLSPVHSEKVLISVETDSPGILVYQDQYYPGWKAFVNGVETPVLKANGIFKAVKIDKPGKFEVEFLFRPTLYVWMEYFFWFCWLALLPLIIIFLIKVNRDENRRNNLSGL